MSKKVKPKPTLSEQELGFIKSEDFSHLRFGFEQETQTVAGCTLDNIHRMINYWHQNSEIDSAAAEVAKKNMVEASMTDPEMLMKAFSYYGAATRYIAQYARVPMSVRDYERSIPLDYAVILYYRNLGVEFFPQDSTLSDSQLALIFRSRIEEDKLNFQAVIDSPVFEKPENINFKKHLQETARQCALNNFDNYRFRKPHSVKNPKYPFIGFTQDEFLKTVHPEFDSRLTACPDGSVAGLEFKPSKPISFEDCKSTTASLFQMPMEVDSRCSFHVHVSIKNNHTEYSETLQMYMCEYIVANLNKVPKTCIERWQNQWQLNRYFAFESGLTKYRFVSFCEKYRTWEFRCFGNIHNADDAMQCITLSALAYKYALRRLNRDTKAVLAPSSRKSFLILKKTLSACLEDTTKLEKTKDVFKEQNEKDKKERGLRRYSKRELSDLNRNYGYRENTEEVCVSDEDAVEALSSFIRNRSA